MRRSLILLVLLLASLFWLEPWLRRINAEEAARYPWLPVLSPEAWSMTVLVTTIAAAVVGVILLVKLALFIWRESDN